jgi:hypothetical protein
MSKTQTTAPAAPAQLEEPKAGGRYRRLPDGGLVQVSKTEQPTGRTKVSQDERQRRLAEAEAARNQPDSTKE